MFTPSRGHRGWGLHRDPFLSPCPCRLTHCEGVRRQQREIRRFWQFREQSQAHSKGQGNIFRDLVFGFIPISPSVGGDVAEGCAGLSCSLIQFDSTDPHARCRERAAVWSCSPPRPRGGTQPAKCKLKSQPGYDSCLKSRNFLKNCLMQKHLRAKPLRVALLSRKRSKIILHYIF